MDINNYIDVMSALYLSGVIGSSLIIGRGGVYQTCTAIRDISIPYGVLGSLIRLILILSDMSEPSKICSALSEALLPILYGIILSSFAHIAVTRLEKITHITRATRQYDFIMQTIAIIVLSIPILVAFSSTLLIVMNIPSIIIVSIGILGFSFAEQSVTNGESYLSTLVNRISFYSVCTTGVGMLIMLIGILKNLHDPKQLGPIIAIGLCTALYSVFYYIGSVLVYRDLNKQTLPHVKMYTISLLILHFLNMALTFFTIAYSFTL